MKCDFAWETETRKTDERKGCTNHSGLKLVGALMSHNSFSLFFRLCVSVLLQGLWQKDTKSAGH